MDVGLKSTSVLRERLRHNTEISLGVDVRARL